MCPDSCCLITVLFFEVVCYAGRDTKIMKNSGKAKFKRTKLDHLLDQLILGVRL
jgi:hypothetical protein